MIRALALTLCLLLAGCATSTEPVSSVPAHGVVGVLDAHLSANYWIRRAPRPHATVLDEAAIATQNQRLIGSDPTVFQLESLPAELPKRQVLDWIAKLSVRPDGTLFNEHGATVSAAELDALVHNVAIDAVPAVRRTRYGLVVQRAALRTFPTQLRVFRSADDADIDRFQESALFPGAPVVIAHTSADDRWFFVVSRYYAAWIERRFVAEGSAEEVFGYFNKTPYLVVTGATVRTAFTRERPELSEVQLDMSTRVPLVSDWPADRSVNGQHPYASHVVELPWRDANGALRFGAALVPKNADVATAYLSLTQANLLQQSFKFLGERYGWGHSYNARDCSGFVSDVYRSFGLQMPRNTRDQGVSPAFEKITFTERDSHASRLEVMRKLQIGDLLYIPGHVMMVIGHDRGMPYVIHDTTGINYRDQDGELRRVSLNGVSVTPLLPLLLGEDQPLIDRIYSVVMMRKR